MNFHSDYEFHENYHEHYNDSSNYSYYDEDFEDYNTVCDKSDVRSFAGLFLPVVYSLALVVGLAGNSIVVFIYLTQKCLRTLTDVLILNLTLADLLLLFTLPFWAADAMNGWETEVVACKITSALYTTNFSCSMLLLAFISVDRYRALAQGSSTYTRSPGNKPRRQRLLSCFLVWIAAFMFGLPDFFLTTIKQHSSGHKSCRAVYPHSMAQAAQASLEFLEVSLSFLLPFLVMMFCYYQVGKTLSQAATKGMREVQRWKAFRVLIAVVGVFLLTQLPYNIVKLIRTIDIIYSLVTSCEVSKGLDQATQVTESLALTHCCLNPILYVFIGSSFKVHVLKIAKHYGQTGRPCHQQNRQPVAEIELKSRTCTNSNAYSIRQGTNKYIYHLAHRPDDQIPKTGNLKTAFVSFIIYTLTVHFNRKTCTPAHSCSYLISQSCGSSGMQKIMQLWVMSTSNIRMKKKSDICDSDSGMDAGTRWAGMSIPKIADLLGILHTTVSRVYTDHTFSPF